MEYLIIGEKKDLETNIFRKLNNLKIKQCYLCLLKQLAGQIKKNSFMYNIL